MKSAAPAAARSAARVSRNASPCAGVLQRKCACGGSCDDCKRKLQRRTADGQGPAGHHFAHDFSGVASARLPNTADVREIARSSGTSAGLELIGHELAHVVQRSPLSSGESAAMPSPFEPRFSNDFSRLLTHANGRDNSEPKKAKCEEFPGGSTDCEMGSNDIPTGKVTSKVTETNPCTRPCVEKHEAVHVRQFKKLCRELRDCYLDAEKGKRPQLDCWAMSARGRKECEAYNVSEPCMAERLKSAGACQSKENKAYGTRKLASERCFRKQACS